MSDQPFGWYGRPGRRDKREVRAGQYRPPKPDPVPKDTEAELKRLAEERAERASILAAILAFEDE